MNIRIIEMLNHFPDNSINNESEDSPLGRFCAFGYHDAIDLRIIEEKQTFWDSLEQVAVERLNGCFNMKTLVCAYKERDMGKKEGEFWKEKSPALPFCFISVIRVDGTHILNKDIHNNIKEQNEDENKMVYYSFEHSEVIAVYRTNCYSKGLETIREFDDIFHAIKSYSVFAVEEKVLDRIGILEGEIVDEEIYLRLNATMKNRKNAINFLEFIRKELNKTGNLVRFEAFDILGNDDLLVEIDGLSLLQILPYYKTGNYLTHSNCLYKEAFYNIETKFILKGGILSAE